MNIMLDLETMGTGPDAAILAIGAVAFDPSTGKITGEFYRFVDLESSVAEGGVIDASTVLWWMRQSDEARKAFEGESVSIGDALDAFAGWISEQPGKPIMWGNGAAFDNVILSQAYRRCGRPVPWTPWNDRCYRTMKNLRPSILAQRCGTHHNALDDARTQAMHLMYIVSQYNP